MNKNTNIIIYIAYIIGIIIIIGIVVASFVSFPNADPSLNLAIARTIFSAITIPIVIVGFIYTLRQLRKAMAKPKIKVAFNEKGEQQIILEYIDNNPGGLPPLWLINEGEEISRFFQVDVIIPKNIANHGGENLLVYFPNMSFNESVNNYILSCTNEGGYTLFINKPYKEPHFILDSALDYKKCIELFKNDFTLKYNIYGNWGNPQKGELKVIIKKQEVPHAGTG